MENQKGLFDTRRRALCAALVVNSLVLFARHFYAYGQDKSNSPTASMLSRLRPRVTELFLKTHSYACWKSRFRPVQRCPCITTGGRVSFSVGTQAASHHMFVTVVRTGVFETFRVRTRQFIPEHGAWSG